MPLVYRTNAPEKLRPLRQHLREEYHPGDSLDYRPRILLTKTQLPIESPKTQQPAIAAVDDAPQEIQMAAKKKAKKTAVAVVAKSRPGVIATIIDCISKEKGATADEIAAVLVKAFPDRDADGMRNTVLIQANKNCTSKEIEEKRGRVYFRRGRK
jgi:hypothetical protein